MKNSVRSLLFSELYLNNTMKVRVSYIVVIAVVVVEMNENRK